MQKLTTILAVSALISTSLAQDMCRNPSLGGYAKYEGSLGTGNYRAIMRPSMGDVV